MTAAAAIVPGMDTRPAAGTRLRYASDDRTFVALDESTTFGTREAVRARLDGGTDDDLFWLLIEFAELEAAAEAEQ